MTIPLRHTSLRARLRRAELHAQQLERRVQERSREAGLSRQQTDALYAYLLELYDLIPGAAMGLSPDGRVVRSNRGACELLGYEESEFMGRPVAQMWPRAEELLQRSLQPAAAGIRCEAEWLARNGERIPVLVSLAAHRDAGAPVSILCVGLDLRERRRLERELRGAHKLESLGQIAAGIAHEINTPMQFIGDNLYFVRDVLRAAAPALTRCDALAGGPGEPITAVDLSERLPAALESALEGVQRVSRIVEAMRAFSHPYAEMGPLDVNKALRDTLTVAQNEYRYVAEVQTDFGELPPVLCSASDINQVFLNLVVNAAQAIEARVRGSDERGLIRVQTRRAGDDIVVEVADDGIGIPESIRHRVFEPFFTTKEVGQGTGQGLAIARAIVVDRHGGTLSYDSQPGRGTTFHVRIPIEGRTHQDSA